jgi:NADH dehydrogenase
MTEKPTRRPRVLIVGAGFGGLAAAKRLAGQPVDVTIIDQRNYHLFQPLLYQVATAALSPADVAWPIRSIFARSPNIRVVLGKVGRRNRSSEAGG